MTHLFLEKKNFNSSIDKTQDYREITIFQKYKTFRSTLRRYKSIELFKPIGKYLNH